MASTSSGGPRLTRRERQVANAVFCGHDYAFIGHQLGISRWTVMRHLLNIYDKTGVGTRCELWSFLLARPAFLDDDDS